MISLEGVGGLDEAFPRRYSTDAFFKCSGVTVPVRGNGGASRDHRRPLTPSAAEAVFISLAPAEQGPGAPPRTATRARTRSHTRSDAPGVIHTPANSATHAHKHACKPTRSERASPGEVRRRRAKGLPPPPTARGRPRGPVAVGGGEGAGRRGGGGRHRGLDARRRSCRSDTATEHSDKRPISLTKLSFLSLTKLDCN